MRSINAVTAPVVNPNFAAISPAVFGPDREMISIARRSARPMPKADATASSNRSRVASKSRSATARSRGEGAGIGFVKQRRRQGSLEEIARAVRRWRTEMYQVPVFDQLSGG